MNKEQQIEEMAKIMRVAPFLQRSGSLEDFLLKRDSAKELYNAGYRKIDDNCAVITKAELKQYKVQAVKEFAEKVKMAFFYEFDEIIPSIMSDRIDELLKDYEK